MSTHNVCFHRVIRKLFTWYSLLSRLMIITKFSLTIFWEKRQNKKGKKQKHYSGLIKYWKNVLFKVRMIQLSLMGVQMKVVLLGDLSVSDDLCVCEENSRYVMGKPTLTSSWYVNAISLSIFFFFFFSAFSANIALDKRRYQLTLVILNKLRYHTHF